MQAAVGSSANKPSLLGDIADVFGRNTPARSRVRFQKGRVRLMSVLRRFLVGVYFARPRRRAVRQGPNQQRVAARRPRHSVWTSSRGQNEEANRARRLDRKEEGSWEGKESCPTVRPHAGASGRDVDLL